VELQVPVESKQKMCEARWHLAKPDKQQCNHFSRNLQIGVIETNQLFRTKS
jgi:hypothetical protein